MNRYLKWAFAEAGNSVAVNHQRYPERHVSEHYFRLRQGKGHSKAEATFYVLNRQEAYRDPKADRVGPGV